MKPSAKEFFKFQKLIRNRPEGEPVCKRDINLQFGRVYHAVYNTGHKLDTSTISNFLPV